MSRRRPAAVLLGAALLSSQLGLTCAPPEPKDPVIELELLGSFPLPGPPARRLLVGVSVDSVAAVQAVDLRASWTGPQARGLSAMLGDDFDDDGAWFRAPYIDWQLSQFRDLTDVRHGDTAVAGRFQVARLWFYAPVGQTLEVKATGTVGLADGTRRAAGSGKLSIVP